MRMARVALPLLLLLTLAVGVAYYLKGGASGESGGKLPELTPFGEAMTVKLYRIAAHASQLRELKPNHEIEQGTLSRERLAEYYAESATDARLQADVNFEALNTTYRLLHMIEPDDDLLEEGQSEADYLLGFYAFEQDQLVLISDRPNKLSLDDEATLAHEFVHSFQDKAFDLSKLFKREETEEKDKANTEYADTLDALIEGDAVLAQLQYIEEKVGLEGLNEWAASSANKAEELDAANEPPPALSRYASFPYTYGSAFVRYLYDKGGWEQVNEAYEDPPKTEEQILHPEKYLAGEEGAGISLRDLSGDLEGDWDQMMDVVFGEFDTYNWLRSTLENEVQAQSAATGWGGGRLAVYANEEAPERVLVQIALIWDDRQEAREFFAGFLDAIKPIDKSPKKLDDSGQIISWRGNGELGQAWLDGTSFQLIVGVGKADLTTALEAVAAPERIRKSGQVLEAGESPGVSQQAIRSLEGVLLQPSDLPPGFVVAQSGDAGVQIPVAGQEVESRTIVYADLASGDAVIAIAMRGSTDGPWAELPQQDAAAFLRSTAQGYTTGAIENISRLPLDGLGEGALGARGELTGLDGQQQLAKFIVFGRGRVMGLVLTIQQQGRPEIDAGALAHIMDSRFQRYQP